MLEPRKPIFDAVRLAAIAAGKGNPFADAAKITLLDGALDAIGIPVASVPIPAITPISGPLGEATWSFAQRQIDVELLCVAFPNRKAADLLEWVQPTQTACVRWGIDTIREVASFLANINVESAGLTQLTENLNYSTEALIKLFGRHRISIEDANRYGRGNGHPANQEALANILYGGDWGRKNLGNVAPTDGWACRGYGPKQITGRANHQAFADAVGMSLAVAQEYMRTPEGGMMAAGWFWKSHGLDKQAATPGVEDDRRAINGGVNGLAEVERGFTRLIEELLCREQAQ
jgi:putative chitinase